MQNDSRSALVHAIHHYTTSKTAQASFQSSVHKRPHFPSSPFVSPISLSAAAELGVSVPLASERRRPYQW